MQMNFAWDSFVFCWLLIILSHLFIMHEWFRVLQNLNSVLKGTINWSRKKQFTFKFLKVDEKRKKKEKKKNNKSKIKQFAFKILKGYERRKIIKKKQQKKQCMWCCPCFFLSCTVTLSCYLLYSCKPFVEVVSWYLILLFLTHPSLEIWTWKLTHLPCKLTHIPCKLTHLFLLIILPAHAHTHLYI